MAKSGNHPPGAKVAGYKQIEHDMGARPLPIPVPSKHIKEVAHVDVFQNTNADNRSTPVTLGKLNEAKSEGIKSRGAGAATKGFTARGPMA